MAKLIMWNLMTLDGFVEGPNRDISWHSDVWGEELEQLSIEQLNAAGGLLFGRVTYELMANHWPSETGEVADFMNAAPKYVFSRTVKKSDWNNTQMFSADVPETVARLKRDSAKDIFLFGSADLACQPDPARPDRRVPHRGESGHSRRRNAAVQAGRKAQAEADRQPAIVDRHRDPALRAGSGKIIFGSNVGARECGPSCYTGSFSMSLTLHFHPLASYCWKALIALYENDIPFTPNLVDLGNPAERAALVKLWGIGKFPVLRDDARNETVPESSIIIEYLDRHYRGRTRFIPDDAGLRPADAAARPLLRSLCASADAEDHVGPDAACGQKGSARRRGSPRATADVLRHDRAADGKWRLGDGRGFQPRRLRRGAAAVLRQHGGAVRAKRRRILRPISSG